MKQQLKLLKVVDFKENEVKTVELPRVYVSKKLQIRIKLGIKGNFSAGDDYGTHVIDSPATILKRIELTAISDKTVTIKNLSAVDILKMSAYEQKGLQENINNLPEGSVSGSDTNTYYVFGSYDLNFACPDVIENAFITKDERGNDLLNPRLYQPSHFTLFNPTLFNPVNLSITFGDINDIQTGFTAGGWTIQEAEVKVYTVDLPEISGVFAVNRQLYKEAVNTGASTDFRIELPKGNMIRKIYVMAIDNGVFSNSLINNVKVVVNENITEYDMSFNAGRNENAKFYGIPFSDLQTGVLVIDFDSDRDLKGLLDVRNVDSIRLSLDINNPTGVSKVRVVTQEITQ